MRASTVRSDTKGGQNRNADEPLVIVISHLHIRPHTSCSFSSRTFIIIQPKPFERRL